MDLNHFGRQASRVYVTNTGRQGLPGFVFTLWQTFPVFSNKPLGDGEAFGLSIRPVRKQIGEAEVRMLGYNGSVPGPVLRVARDRRSP
jgi:hypothetical protein